MRFKKLVSVTLALTLLLGGNTALTPTPNKASAAASSDFTYSKAATEAMNYINEIRKKAGLQPVKLNPYLTKAAENHANYLTINGYDGGHVEDKSKKGFTGKEVWARV